MQVEKLWKKIGNNEKFACVLLCIWPKQIDIVCKKNKNNYEQRDKQEGKAVFSKRNATKTFFSTFNMYIYIWWCLQHFKINVWCNDDTSQTFILLCVQQFWIAWYINLEKTMLACEKRNQTKICCLGIFMLVYSYVFSVSQCFSCLWSSCAFRFL